MAPLAGARFLPTPGSYLRQVPTYARFLPTPGSYLRQVPTCARFLPTPGSYLLVCQSLSLLFAIGNDTAPLEAEPVDGTNHKEDNQRELEDRYIAKHI